MIDNTLNVRRLLAENALPIACDPTVALPGLPRDPVDWARVEGMLLGLAIGDSLGNTSESMVPGARAGAYGEIRDYLRNEYADGRAVGVPTDDTQMAAWTLEVLVADGGLVPQDLVERFRVERIFGIGATVRAFLDACSQGADWTRSGRRSAGNGALMRIAPVLVPHLREPGPGLWADAVLAGFVTHNDAASIASCVAFVNLLWLAMRRTSPPETGWWVETFCAVARAVEGESRDYVTRSPHMAPRPTTLWDFTRTNVTAALAADKAARDACDRWYSGAFLLETVPSALYILERHGHDPEEAIVRAVNDTRDNDTIAAIVGAAVGALHGRDALPSRWRAGLLGRTAANDDGRLFELLDQARASFG